MELKLGGSPLEKARAWRGFHQRCPVHAPPVCSCPAGGPNTSTRGHVACLVGTGVAPPPPQVGTPEPGGQRLQLPPQRWEEVNTPSPPQGYRDPGRGGSALRRALPAGPGNKAGLAPRPSPQPRRPGGSSRSCAVGRPLPTSTHGRRRRLRALTGCEKLIQV